MPVTTMVTGQPELIENPLTFYYFTSVSPPFGGKSSPSQKTRKIPLPQVVQETRLPPRFAWKIHLPKPKSGGIFRSDKGDSLCLPFYADCIITVGHKNMIQVIASISLALGALIVLFNWYSIYASYRSGGHVSPVPVLGAVLLGLGLLGFPETRTYAWVGIVVDYGTIILIVAIPSMIWEAWTTCPFNLVHRFVSESSGRHDDIRLFKRGKFTIRSEYNPPVPCDKHGAMALSLGFVGTWREESKGFVLEGYAENRVLHVLRFDGHYKTMEKNYPENQEFPVDRLDSMELKRLK